MGTTGFQRHLGALGLDLTGNLPIKNTTFGGRIEAGYSFDLGNSAGHIVPFLAIEPMSVRQQTATESLIAPDNSPFKLLETHEGQITFHGRTITAMPVSVGVQLSGHWQTYSNGAFAPQMRVAWLHDLEPDRDIARSFAELQSLLVSRTSVPADVDAAQIQLSGLWTGQKWSFKASVDAQVSQSYETLGGTLSWEWNSGRRWSIRTTMDAKLSQLQGEAGGMVHARYAW
jgi:outer membrane autotransporter protein